MTIVDTGRHAFFRHRFLILFILLLCVLLIPPYFQNSPWIGTFWRGLFTCVMLWALYTIAGTPRVLLLAVLVLIPTIASTWLSDDGQEKTVAYLDNATNIVYLTIICYYLSKYILTTRKVTSEVIFSAMCLYMILAVLWAAIYTNLELFYPGTFIFNGLPAAEAGVDANNLYLQLIYYSFVTLSTLGYGDILPTHRVAQNWAAIEAMIGQFYIAIVMARLVSVYTVEEEEEYLETK
jgi:hypothetical protein